MKVLVLFYSLYGHVYEMAKSVGKGVKDVKGAKIKICMVPETLPDEVIEKMGAVESKEKMKDVPIAKVSDLEEADAVILGTPTRFGNMCGQMRQFLDATGGLWMKGTLVGKVGSVFTSSSTQHGGQESTILSTHITLLHHGMVIAGLPYAFKGQMDNSDITGGSPYGASTIAGTQSERTPSENELDGARFQGKYVTEIAMKLQKK